MRDDMWLNVAVVTPGDGRTFPQAGQTVCVHYEGKFDNAERCWYSTRQKGKPIRFVVGDGVLVKGLEEGVRKMSVGERAKISCTGYYTQGPASPKSKSKKKERECEDGERTLVLDVLLLSCT